MTPAPALEVALLIYDIHELYNKGALMLTLPIDFANLILAFAPLNSCACLQLCASVGSRSHLGSWKTHHHCHLTGDGIESGKARISSTIASSTERFGQILLKAYVLLGMLVTAFAATGPLVMGLDDTIERRRGEKIKAKGIYRDPVRKESWSFRQSKWTALVESDVAS